MNIHPHKLLTFTTVRDLLQEEGGLKKREAESLLEQNQPEPEWMLMAALRITRRRWRPKTVLDFCARLQNGDAPLGKGVPDANSNS